MSRTVTKSSEVPNVVPGPGPGQTALVPSGQNGPPAEAAAPGPAARERPRCPNLYAALALAQQRCCSAKHDKKHYHGFSYASSEAVLLVAQEALDDSGLAVMALGWDVEVRGPVPILKRLFRLVHESGECGPDVPCVWPILEEKGRPLDKALAGALTECQAYYYRDLLRMPRVRPEDDLAGRVDAPVRPLAPKLEKALGEAIDEATAATPPAAPRDKSLASPCTVGQVSRIVVLRDELGLSAEAFDTRLKVKYGAGSISNLTSGQAAEVIGLLEQQAYRNALAEREHFPDVPPPQEVPPGPGAGKS